MLFYNSCIIFIRPLSMVSAFKIQLPFPRYSNLLKTKKKDSLSKGIAVASTNRIYMFLSVNIKLNCIFN